MQTIVIIGAGAIGRGFLPWIFEEENRLVFIDSDPRIVNLMRAENKYQTYMVKNGVLTPKTIQIEAVYFPEEFVRQHYQGVAAAFISVGPRNCVSAAQLVAPLNCPIILCENDPATVDSVKRRLGRKDVYFAIPDVVTSNTASPSVLKNDPLAVVSEDGTLFVDARVGNISGEFTRCDPSELAKQWTAKLYLHNTPHCVAAYIGAFSKINYIHEVMNQPCIHSVVKGAMEEMLGVLKLEPNSSHDFLDWYANKELSRFSSPQLYDPISRVAREPLRKLHLDERLVGAAQLCLSAGIVPRYILMGIVSAVLFDRQTDADKHIAVLNRALTTELFMTHVIGLRKGEALEILLTNRFDSIVEELRALVFQVQNQFKIDGGTCGIEVGL